MQWKSARLLPLINLIEWGAVHHQHFGVRNLYFICGAIIALHLPRPAFRGPFRRRAVSAREVFFHFRKHGQINRRPLNIKVTAFMNPKFGGRCWHILIGHLDLPVVSGVRDDVEHDGTPSVAFRR